MFRNTPWLLSAFVVFASLALGWAEPAGAQATAPYERTIIVSPVPGDTLASGAALRAAVASVTPSAAAPWRIKLEPGIYDLGTEPLELKRRFNLEGSGTDVTTIRGQGQFSLDRSQGILIGADKMEMSDFRLECHSSAARPWCIALANVEVSPRITNVHFVVNGAFSGNWGMRNSGASPTLDRVTMTIARANINYGMVNARGKVSESHPTIRRSVILAKGGSSINYGIFERDGSSVSLVEDSEVTAFGGLEAGALRTTGLAFTAEPVVLRRVTFLAHSANQTYGAIGEGYPRIEVEHSRIEALGPISLGVGSASPDVEITHSTIQGNTFIVSGNNIDIRFTTLAGSGTLPSFANCVAIISSAGIFRPSTCL